MLWDTCQLNLLRSELLYLMEQIHINSQLIISCFWRRISWKFFSLLKQQQHQQQQVIEYKENVELTDTQYLLN